MFAGGFELDAAEGSAPATSGGDLLDVVASLVDKSILIREEYGGRRCDTDCSRRCGTTAASNSTRPASTCSCADDIATGTRRWCCSAEAEWIGPRQPTWIARLERERPNLQDALEYCMTEPGEAENGLRIAVALYLFWRARGCSTKVAVARTASWDAHGRSDQERAKALAAATVLAGNQGDIEAGDTLIERGLRRRRADRRPRHVALVVHAAGHLAILRGRPARGGPASTASRIPRSGPDRLQRHIATVLGLAMATAVLGDGTRPSSTPRSPRDHDGPRRIRFTAPSAVSAGLSIVARRPAPAPRPLFEAGRCS